MAMGMAITGTTANPRMCMAMVKDSSFNAVSAPPAPSFNLKAIFPSSFRSGRRRKINKFTCERRPSVPEITIQRGFGRRKSGNRGSVQKRSPLTPGIVQPRLPVPSHIPKPPYVNSPSLPELAKELQTHDAEGIKQMRAACQLAARVLDYAGTLIKPSVTTDDIDKAVHEMIISSGAYPSPLGYGGFPKSVCTSVNECMCHGIPDSRPLQGYHGDTSKTFPCGNVDEEAKRLVKATEECLYKGISACKAGKGYKQIGKKINKLADKYGYRVDKRFVGHGVGKVFHSEPIICHFRNDMPGCMVAGQTFTIEPILTIGSTECIVWDDNWTTVTADGSLAAQFEHTILITETGAEILTIC
eukprot:TRINITY_DN736_c0_g1_i4.p1 TRINITY_DN736_c0_g1~~TRINITY_DN736_c0_g1_i4.p1  ORF type:complete len:357 (+),score=73.41 TRINITY_DN736_c0_g1_i4:95-1165(+)